VWSNGSTLRMLPFVASIWATAAAADAPTHRFNVIEIHTDNHFDCGGGSCASACILNASLTNLSYKPQDRIEVAFMYENPVVESGVSSVGYQFDALAVGSSSERQEEEFPGIACKDVKVKSIRVNCLETHGDRCSGFVNINIPNIDLLKIKRHSVSQ
jgi:hypothetical protein